MQRNTLITLYKTQRIDATYQNIWAFNDKTERLQWLTSKPHRDFYNCKYWKYGEPIKLEIPFYIAMDFDYAKITNNAGEQGVEKSYYCFITNRAYISDNLSVFYLDVDIVQTWYFDSIGLPCWKKDAMIAKSTAPISPPRGTANDFPAVDPICRGFISSPPLYGVVIYSTINLANLNNITYVSATIDGQYTAAPPYVMKSDLNAIMNLINTVNSKGYTDAISGIYIFPAIYCNNSFLTTTPKLAIGEDFYQDARITIHRPTSCDGYTPKNNVLLGYDYTYFTINNGFGEAIKYNFEFFDGDPVFGVRLCLAGGSPSMICYPINYITGTQEEQKQLSQKISVPVSCSYLNDSYKIWLAQSQNSRQAALNQAAESIRQAEQAKNASYAANLAEPVNTVEQYARGLISGAADKLEQFGNLFSGDGIAGIFGKKQQKTEQTQGLSITEVADTLTDIGIAYVNRQLGIETAYQYDHAIKNAQLAQDALLASYRDRAAVPAQAVGSNAYGDMTAFGQYGFMFATYTPTAEFAEWIDKTLSASGHTVNKWGRIARYHKTFDFYKCTSMQIFANSARPEFARYHIMSIFNRGVYLWYYNDGDISPAIGIPYNLPNEVI